MHIDNGHPLTRGMAPEQAAVVRAVLSAEPRPGAPDAKDLAQEERNDLGNARRLRARHGGDLAWVEEVGWLVWDGRRWSADGGEGQALMRAQSTAEAMLAEEYPHRRTEDFERFAIQSGNRSRCEAMLASAAPHLRVRHDMLDGDPYRVNVRNGTIDLANGMALYPHKRSDWITKMAAVEHDMEADCPRWERFVADVLPDAPGQEGCARFVQKWLGYALSGDITEQIVVQFEGKGANGKSTLLEVVARIMGDYATVTPIETFLHNDRRSGSGPSPDIARLPGARLVRASEPEPGARLSESVIKQWTGGERMVARMLHRDFFEFTPQGKLTLSVNIRPVIVGKDHGIRRRIKVVPFTQQFKPGGGRTRGQTLVEELMEEAPGILNWLLEGYALWREEGMEPPPAVVAATDAYFTEMDPIGAFVREAAVQTGERHDKVSSGDLFAAYQRWCRANNEDEKSQTAFGRRMGDLGIKKATLAGRVYYSGVTLAEEWKAAARGEGRPADDE